MSRFAQRFNRCVAQVGRDHFDSVVHHRNGNEAATIDRAFVGDWENEQVETEWGLVDRKYRFVSICVDESFPDYSGLDEIIRTDEFTIDGEKLSVLDISKSSTGWVEAKLTKEDIAAIGQHQFGRG